MFAGGGVACVLVEAGREVVVFTVSVAVVIVAGRGVVCMLCEDWTAVVLAVHDASADPLPTQLHIDVQTIYTLTLFACASERAHE